MRRPGLFFSLLLLFACLPAGAQSYVSGPRVEQAQGYASVVAVHGDAVLVAEPMNDYTPGYVFVYRKGADGTWSETGRIEASDAVAADRFGASLAVDGDHLLVGATYVDGERGAAYLFERDGMDYREVGRLVADDLAEGDRFGADVAVEGDWALVGTVRQNEEAGAAYLFQRGADGTWTQQAKLTPSDAEAGDYFGQEVALEQGYALVAAPRKAEGMVYVFQNGGSGWDEVDVLTGTGVEDGQRFGESLAAADGLLLVAAPRVDGFAGAAYVFELDDEGAWAQAGRLLPFDAGRQYRFGTGLAFDGRTAWIGAPGAQRFSGRAYVYERDAETGEWLSAAKPGADSRSARDFFAASVGIAGDVAVAGVLGADHGAGTAQIFERIDGAWMPQTTVYSQTGSLSAVTGEKVLCADGVANGWDCQEMDLLAFLPITEIGGTRGVRLNDIWGWTDPATGKEYALVGRIDGTSFVDVSDPSNPVYLGQLPMTEGANANSWRDMKVYDNHVFVVADASGEHGMQVFDLTQLRGLDGSEPTTFEATAHYDNINSAHNIVINEETGYAYIVGSSGGGETCGGGLHMVNIQDPERPTFAGCFADPETGRASTGYSHDAQCIVYRGPDAEHQGKEICFGSNETAFSIADVTDKENPVALSRASYPNVAYTHQGWVTDDHRYFFVNDELDELSGNVSNTRTLIWDITDLDDPQLVKEFLQDNESSDHNLYIRGNYMYQSNYASGLRVFDISDVENPVEVGYFDTVPVGDNSPGFSGSWSNYPFFESGTIVVTSIGEGLFIVKKKEVDI